MRAHLVQWAILASVLVVPWWGLLAHGREWLLLVA